MKAAALAILLLSADAAAAECRQALAIGLDISGSVDATEYRLQLDGLAQALGRPAVRAAIFGVPGAEVDLAIYEWAGSGNFRLTVPWVALVDRAALEAVIAQLEAAERPGAAPATALGTAMRAGAGLLAERSDCWRQVLDISGDGPSNAGPRPRDVRPALENAGLTVNGLTIETASAEDLSGYYRAEVIAGPEAFVERAAGFADYADAMERKLVRELRVPVVGAASAPRDQ